MAYKAFKAELLKGENIILLHLLQILHMKKFYKLCLVIFQKIMLFNI